MKRNARDAAYDVLFSMEQKKAYSNLALDRALSLPLADERDASLIKKLTDGVLERKMTLDYQIKRHLLSPKIRIKPPVRTILRMGIYEILFCDGIPARASVNEYVQLAKKRGYSHASGLINAILRKTAESGLLLPPKGTAEFLSVFYSCPLQMLALLHKVYGKDTESFLAASLKKPKIYGRVNTLRTNMDTLCSVLAAEGIQITPSNVLPDAFYFTDSAAFMRTQAFASGLFHIQDLSSQLCCAALLPAEGQSVLDVCAAPGGKTFTIAETLANTGSVLSCDIYRHKIDLIQNGADRLGLTNVTARLRDAATDETPLQGAVRELEEETGLRNADLRFIGELYTSPAILTEVIHMYIATGFTAGEQHPDDDEFVRLVTMPLDKAVQKILDGEIKDAKTQAAVLKTALLLKD